MWPENMCQWNGTGLPVTSYLSMNVVGSHNSENFVALARFAMVFSSFSHIAQRRRIHVHPFSIDFLLATPVEINHSKILFSNCGTELP